MLPVTDAVDEQQVRRRLRADAVHQAGELFAADPQDRADLLAAARLVRDDPALLHDVTAVVNRLRTGMGRVMSQEAAHLPDRFDPQDPREPVQRRFFYPVAFAATLPDTLAFHRAHGVPERQSAAVMADVGRHLRIFRQTFGHNGLHVQNWFSLHFRGLLYDFGRLQAAPAQSTLIADQARAAELPTTTDVMADVHIPATGPLRPAEVDESLARIRPFFDAHFPPFAGMTLALCTSWLLDRQLVDLVPGSNIAAFTQRWQPVGSGDDGDRSVRDFVFRRPFATPDELTATTRLETAALAHWRAGRHFRQMTGWLPLPGAGSAGSGPQAAD